MSKTNGKVDDAAAVAAVRQQPEPWRPKTYTLTLDELSGRDMKRAKAQVLGGKEPWDWIAGDDSDEADVRTLIIWCLKSRHIPGFTWEQAEDTPYKEFLPARDNPPPTPPLDSSGRSETTPSGSESTPPPPTPEPAPSSAPSTT
jgi:hypothetical protein